jgi:signal transduction histidine kinase
MGVIKDNFEVTIQTRGVNFIQNNSLPDVLCDKTQMVQLFQNIIGNAIKFMRPDVTPVIELSSSIVHKEELMGEINTPLYQEYYKIRVGDNGIGFDEQYMDKIFVIFQRLHGRSEYDGTGIGLSICKRIVENHQGYIHARSRPGEGSEFFIYLPKVDIKRK